MRAGTEAERVAAAAKVAAWVVVAAEATATVAGWGPAAGSAAALAEEGEEAAARVWGAVVEAVEAER